MAMQVDLSVADRPSAVFLDLRLHAQRTGRLLAGVGRDDFLGDPMLRDATMFNLVRIAEVVRQLPGEAMARYPAVDWTALGQFTAERASEMSDNDHLAAWQVAAVAVAPLLDLDVPPDDRLDTFSDTPSGRVIDASSLRVELPTSDLANFCRRWRVAQLEVFGSALRQDFGPSSDVDFLVTFQPDAPWGMFDHIRMQDELAALLDRKVDLIERRAIETSPNWIRRRHILATARPIWCDDSA